MKTLRILALLLLFAIASPVMSCADTLTQEGTEQTDSDDNKDDASGEEDGAGEDDPAGEDDGTGEEGTAGEEDGTGEDGTDDEIGSGTEPTPTPDDGILKILAIGNSFSQDAVEQYLWELLDAAGIPAVIGNLYIGGCTIDTHCKNMTSGAEKYAYRKVTDGSSNKTEKQNTSLLYGITDEDWDIITLQQASGSSGIYSTYTHLPDLIKYVEENATNTEMKLGFHYTWAYAQSSDHGEFPKYDSDQLTMYNAITSAVQQAMADNPSLEIVIPSGTAIQNGRNSFLGDSFNRDGYHLNVYYGRYTASCTWFEALTGQSVVGNSYVPDNVDADQARIAQNAAHFAVQDPYKVNPMNDFKAPAVTSDGTEPIYIDFGSSRSSSWNNVAVYELSNSEIHLKDAEGQYTAVLISEISGFTGMYNGIGSEPSDQNIEAGGITWLRDAWVDGILVSGAKGGGDVGPAKVVFSGLDPSVTYDFDILAVRYNGSADARITRFSVTGATRSDEVDMKPGMKSWTGENLENYLVTFTDVKPSADGTVTVSVTGIDTGLAADGLINALVISR